MIIVILLITGLACGSFVNALTWRLYMQEHKPKTKKIQGKDVDLSITKGRSVCIHCGHELAAKDLIPVLSWLSLRGKCRYCRGPIEDTPLPELGTAALFVVSYLAWPFALEAPVDWLALVAWLAIVVGLVALVVYDLRHLLLPNKIVFPLMFIGAGYRLALHISLSDTLSQTLLDVAYGLLVGGGIFYVIFQISQGKWIGGGDVKLGFLIGLVLGWENALVALLAAFYIAAFVILPLMVAKKVTRKSKIPFGPFLIAGFVLAMLWGEAIRDGYSSLFGL